MDEDGVEAGGVLAGENEQVGAVRPIPEVDFANDHIGEAGIGGTEGFDDVRTTDGGLEGKDLAFAKEAFPERLDGRCKVVASGERGAAAAVDGDVHDSALRGAARSVEIEGDDG